MWKEIDFLTGYQVSSNGEVRGPRKVLSQWTDERGCRRVQAGGRPQAVHELVLSVFVGPRPDGAVPRWINGDMSDNRLLNLRWHTPGKDVATRSNRCRRGHLYTDDNTTKWGTGHRICIACRDGAPAITELPEII